MWFTEDKIFQILYSMKKKNDMVARVVKYMHMPWKE